MAAMKKLIFTMAIIVRRGITHGARPGTGWTRTRPRRPADPAGQARPLRGRGRRCELARPRDERRRHPHGHQAAGRPELQRPHRANQNGHRPAGEVRDRHAPSCGSHRQHREVHRGRRPGPRTREPEEEPGDLSEQPAAGTAEPHLQQQRLRREARRRRGAGSPLRPLAHERRQRRLLPGSEGYCAQRRGDDRRHGTADRLRRRRQRARVEAGAHAHARARLRRGDSRQRPGADEGRRAGVQDEVRHGDRSRDRARPQAAFRKISS